ncbi:hypothetical protein [Vibrio owensii]|uniref:hypothetical protein n=1 Tax=Vibrio owensii TaxID=696485 RepID=UPI0018F12478|nr:hypothetical protein [Vibrio owensii]
MTTLTDIEQRALYLTTVIRKQSARSSIIANATSAPLDADLIKASDELNSILNAKVNAKVQYFVIYDGSKFWNLSPREWTLLCREGAASGTCPLLDEQRSTINAPPGIAHHGNIALEVDNNVRLVQPHHWDQATFRTELSRVTETA